MNTRKILMIIACLLFTLALFGQSSISQADKDIQEINADKKYIITQFTDKNDLALIGDSLSLLTTYRKKGNNKGKDVQEYRNRALTKFVTYYHNAVGLFAIDESINSSGIETQRLRFYFADGKLLKVIDKDGNDQTGTVDQKELYHRIFRLYDDQIIVK